MGYIRGSKDGPGYTAPRPSNEEKTWQEAIDILRRAQDELSGFSLGGVKALRPNGMAHADGSTCYDGVPCPPLEDLDAFVDDIEFRRPYRSARKHPAAADNERLANFLLQHFASAPQTITEGSAVDIAIEILRSTLAVAAEPPTTMADPRTVQPGEVRSVDPRTGAEKGVKLARFDLIPQGPLYELAEHYGLGAGKYQDHQWRAGYDWSKSYSALGRHLSAFWSGEEIDPDPAMKGATHLAAAAWHVFTLMEFTRTFPDGDDRWKGNDY